MKSDQLAPGVAPNLIGLAVCQWHNEDQDGARASIARLLMEEPAFRLGEALAPPFRDPAVWARFLEALRAAGAPE